MANKKISQLTEVTNPNSTDVIPVVNASETKKTQLGNLPISDATQSALDGKQDTLGYTAENVANRSTDVDADKTSLIKYPVVKAVYDWAVSLFATISQLNTKQDALVSGTNIKTINSESLLGSGDIAIDVDLAPITVDGNSVSISKDSTATTQDTAVIKSTDTNAGIAIVPNGTGAITANVPDGMATGGNARGAYAVDLQRVRSANNQVAGGSNSIILGGANNRINTLQPYGVIVGGINNYVNANSTSIVGGSNNQSNSEYSFIGGGASNLASSSYSTISGGQSNTASTGTHATVVGGSGNTSSGQYSISGGNGNTASGQSSIAMGLNNTSGASRRNISIGENNTASGLDGTTAIGKNNNISGNDAAIGIGNNNTVSGQISFAFGQNNNVSGDNSASFGSVNQVLQNQAFAYGRNNRLNGQYTTSLGFDSKSDGSFGLTTGKRAWNYLYGQRAHASEWFGTSPEWGNAQFSELIARKEDTLTTAATTVLSLDGTGTTNLIIPNGNKHVWNVTLKYSSVVTGITGTATGVNVGDCKNEVLTIGFKRIGGTSSVVGSLNTLSTNQDSSMSGAGLAVTAGTSQEMKLEFTAPTFSGGGSVTVRVVAKVELTEVAY